MIQRASTNDTHPSPSSYHSAPGRFADPNGTAPLTRLAQKDSAPTSPPRAPGAIGALASAPPRQRVDILSAGQVSQLLKALTRQIRVRHYSIRTERSYVDWVERFLRFHANRNPRYLDNMHVNAFLSHLASDLDVAASTQNQALSAILFLYRSLYQVELGDLGNVHRARKPKRLPVVLSLEETATLLSRMTGTSALMTELLYGTGMRIIEVIRLRVKDLDLGRGLITIREAKGDKDRVVALPSDLAGRLQAHLVRVRALHEQDLAEGYGSVYLPHEEGSTRC